MVVVVVVVVVLIVVVIGYAWGVGGLEAATHIHGKYWEIFEIFE